MFETALDDEKSNKIVPALVHFLPINYCIQSWYLENFNLMHEINQMNRMFCRKSAEAAVDRPGPFLL